MKKIVIALLMFGSIHLSAQTNLLSGKYSRQKLNNVIIPLDQWIPFPKITDRAAWAKADEKMMKANLAEAEGYLTYTWPSVPATKSLLIFRTGDRNEYQKISFEKRNVLGCLLIAEIYENKGRFIDQIIDGVWSVCEESFWGASAHLPKTKVLSGLIDVTDPFVELFSAETSTLLAWVDYYLGDKLDAISPQVTKRIYHEVNTRIFVPAMTKPHGWMTANANGRRPNNWNPWISSNWLNSALLLEKDPVRRTDMVYKIINVIDQFLNPYPQDGGCDEGPGYWGAAAASLYDNIAMLNTASNNMFEYAFNSEKIKNMGRFIYRAQIGDKYFLNFADASPQPKMAASMIYRFGKDIADADMMKFGAYYLDNDAGKLSRSMYFRNFYALFMQNELRQAEQGLPLPKNVWLPDIQVMMARDNQGTSKGFFVAAKGGNNDESHNHNDIGNFVVYYDGLPVLIDVGSGTYTARTFSSKRYDIWSNRSNYHNVPAINNTTQPPGANFKASNVSYDENDNFTEMKMDIATSYGDSAAATSVQRKVRLNRGQNVEVTDVFNLKKAGNLTEHMMTCYPAEITKPGMLVIHYKDEGGTPKDFAVTYNASQLEPLIEKVPLTAMEDKGVIEKWGDNIYRINFKVKKPKVKDTVKFVVAVK